MKLFYTPGVCSLAPHIVLEWIGAPYETEAVQIAGQKSPALLEVNPIGAVPVLQEDDWTLTQNSAILSYLAETHADTGLGGDDSARSHTEVARWVGFVNSDLHPAFRPLFAGAAHLEDEAAEQKEKAQAAQRIRGKFEIVEDQLTDRDWLSGQRSVADPYLYTTLRWADMLGIDVSDLGNLTRFVERMEADEGVQAVLKQEGLDPISKA